MFDEIHWNFIDPKYFGPFTTIEDRLGLLSPLFKDTGGWFAQDLRERLQDYPPKLPSDRPVKRYRASINDSAKQKSLANGGAPIPDWTNPQQVIRRYKRAFRGIPRNNCRWLAQAWVELTEPGKLSTHPYQGGDDAKTDWWPENVRHCTPHHMPKEGGLLVFTCQLA
jgi:hypothetical protein